MKMVNTSLLSSDECMGIQINGLIHCNRINCKWKGISACSGINIILTGRNSKGYRIGQNGLIESDRTTA
ncbi:MAG: hypothetical protein Q8O72_02495 [Bacteroidales bacterium]|jgi:hypothetical protein|nr:hypothetical protein [Bacteroidales bacterium]